MDCLPRGSHCGEVALSRSSTVVVSFSCTYDSVGVTPRIVSVVRSVQAKDKVAHAFLQRLK